MKAPEDLRAYRLWYEFLKLHDGYRRHCLEGRGNYGRLYEDFGNVHRLDFRAWWTQRWRLFAVPTVRDLVEPIKCFEHAENLDGREAAVTAVSEALSNSDRAVFVVNLLESKRALRRDFGMKLSAIHPGKPGRPKFDNTEADRYELYQRPDIESLRTTLKVYRLAMRHVDWPEWKVALKAKLRTDEEGELIEGDLDTPLKKAVLTATVSRMLRRAEALIENVARGEFPNPEFQRFRPRKTLRRARRRAAGLGG